MTRPLRSSPHYQGLHRYYGTVRPCAPHRYSAPRGFRPLGFSLSADRVAIRPSERSHSIGTTGSHVPHQSLNRARATSMPGTAWAVSRYPPGSSRRATHSPGFDVIHTLSTRHQWFALARLLDSYLTALELSAFSATLTTPALDRRSLRWFETSPCRAAAEDLPPSLIQHRSFGSIFYIDPSFVRGTHHPCRAHGESSEVSAGDAGAARTAHESPVSPCQHTGPGGVLAGRDRGARGNRRCRVRRQPRNHYRQVPRGNTPQHR